MIWVLLGIIVLAVGLGFHRYQLYHSLVGYNKMTEEQKEKTDLNGMSLYFANLAYFIAIMLFVLAVLSFYELQSLYSIIFVVIAVVTISGVFDSKRYIKTFTDEHAKPTKIKKYMFSQLIGYLFGAGVIIAIIVIFALKPVSIAVDNQILDITGSYGNTYPIEAIEELRLESTPLEIVETINGSAKQNQLQGLFMLKQDEQALLYINENVDTYISLSVGGDRIYLNLNTEEQTLELYEQLKLAIK